MTLFAEALPRGGEPVKRTWRFRLGAWFTRRWERRRARRMHRRLHPRKLRRQLRRLDLDEQQLDCALRVQQQLSELRASAEQQRRQMSWQLLSVVLDPQQQRPQAMQSVTQLTRSVDEKAAELIMSLAEFGAQLRDEQRQAVKRWLAHG